MTFVGTISEINNALEGLRFDPTPDYNGPATIDITVDDQGNIGSGGAKTDLDTINITVTAVNDAPVANDASFSVDEHSPVGTPVGTVFASDVDTGDALTYRIVGGSGDGVFGIDPTTGEVIVVDPSRLVYETNPSLNLSVEVEDLAGATDTAEVTILLVNVDDPPVAANDGYEVDSLSSLAVAAPGVLANDVDPDGDPLSAFLVTGPSHGTLTLGVDGTFEYTPDEGFVGYDTFTYRTTDGREDSGLAVVTIEVLPIGQMPDGGSSDTGSDESSQEAQTDQSQNEEGSNSEEPENAPQQSSRRDSLHHDALPPINTADLPQTVESLPESASQTDSTVSALVDAREVDTAPDPTVGWDGGENSGTSENALSDGDLVQREYGTLWSQLDTLAEDVMEDVESENTFESLVVGTTAVSVTGLTVGYVLWLLRGGTLLASLVSSLPAWCAFDPLPILDNFDASKDRRRDKHDISFESLVAGRDQNPPSAQAIIS
jgi:hypothetical protein